MGHHHFNEGHPVGLLAYLRLAERAPPIFTSYTSSRLHSGDRQGSWSPDSNIGPAPIGARDGEAGCAATLVAVSSLAASSVVPGHWIGCTSRSSLLKMLCSGQLDLRRNAR